jgi:hypothetical protein
MWNGRLHAGFGPLKNSRKARRLRAGHDHVVAARDRFLIVAGIMDNRGLREYSQPGKVAALSAEGANRFTDPARALRLNRPEQPF